MKMNYRCDCPITTALDVLGDKWMLVLIKQMLFEGMQTFKEFVESDEAIATNILSTKLKLLEQLGFVEKRDHPSNKKTKLYLLTEKGLTLTPVLVELGLWSDKTLREYNPVMRQTEALEWMKRDKSSFIDHLQKEYRRNYDQVGI